MPPPKPIQGALLMALTLFRNLELTFEQIDKNSVAMYDFTFCIKSCKIEEKKTYCQTKSLATESLKTKSNLGEQLGHKF